MNSWYQPLKILIMKLAIKNGADVNCAHPDGGSLLSVVVDFTIDSNYQAGGKPGDEDLKYIELLLINGADINLRYGGFTSAVEAAKVYRSAKNIVTYLEGYNA